MAWITNKEDYLRQSQCKFRKKNASEHGYERTTLIDGHKAYEKYDGRSETGEISIIVEDRFIVNIKGDNIREKDLQTALRKLDLSGLERLN